jgi:hypothetical protein
MADHHDSGGDIVDSALALLRSRQWAGPCTNTSIERLLMRASKTDKRVNLRLVLGIGMALLGCGAVAAATRPAWRAVFQSEPKVAIKQSAPKPTEHASVAAPKPIAVAAKPHVISAPPAVVAAAPPVVQAAPTPEPEMQGAEVLDFESEILAPTADDLIAEDDRLMAAFYQSLMAGDADCCEAIVGMLNGQQWKPPVIREFRADGLRMSALGQMAQVELGVWQRVELDMPIELSGEAITLDAGVEFVFTATLDGESVEGQDLMLSLDDPELLEGSLMPGKFIVLRATPVVVPAVPAPQNKP